MTDYELPRGYTWAGFLRGILTGLVVVPACLGVALAVHAIVGPLTGVATGILLLGASLLGFLLQQRLQFERRLSHEPVPGVLMELLLEKSPGVHSSMMSRAARLLAAESELRGRLLRFGPAASLLAIAPIAERFEPAPLGDSLSPLGEMTDARAVRARRGQQRRWLSAGLLVIFIGWQAYRGSNPGLMAIPVAIALVILGATRMCRRRNVLVNQGVARRERGRWRLFARSECVALALASENGWSVCISDGEHVISTRLSEAGAWAFFAAWLSPVEPVPIERWSDYSDGQ